MLTRFGALDSGVPVMPIAVPTLPALAESELRAAALDDYDSAIAALDRALVDVNVARVLLWEAEHQRVIAEHRAALARAALV